MCPFIGHVGAVASAAPTTNREWWPNPINIGRLHQHHPGSNPLAGTYGYAPAFVQLNYHPHKADLSALMTVSQECWPANWVGCHACGAAIQPA
jgi:catalase-peroxidase